MKIQKEGLPVEQQIVIRQGAEAFLEEGLKFTEEEDVSEAIPSLWHTQLHNFLGIARLGIPVGIPIGSVALEKAIQLFAEKFEALTPREIVPLENSYGMYDPNQDKWQTGEKEKSALELAKLLLLRNVGGDVDEAVAYALREDIFGQDATQLPSRIDILISAAQITNDSGNGGKAKIKDILAKASKLVKASLNGKSKEKPSSSVDNARRSVYLNAESVDAGLALVRAYGHFGIIDRREQLLNIIIQHVDSVKLPLRIGIGDLAKAHGNIIETMYYVGEIERSQERLRSLAVGLPGTISSIIEQIQNTNALSSSKRDDESRLFEEVKGFAKLVPAAIRIGMADEAFEWLKIATSIVNDPKYTDALGSSIYAAAVHEHLATAYGIIANSVFLDEEKRVQAKRIAQDHIELMVQYDLIQIDGEYRRESSSYRRKDYFMPIMHIKDALEILHTFPDADLDSFLHALSEFANEHSEDGALQKELEGVKASVYIFQKDIPHAIASFSKLVKSSADLIREVTSKYLLRDIISLFRENGKLEDIPDAFAGVFPQEIMDLLYDAIIAVCTNERISGGVSIGMLSSSEMILLREFDEKTRAIKRKRREERNIAENTELDIESAFDSTEARHLGLKGEQAENRQHNMLVASFALTAAAQGNQKEAKRMLEEDIFPDKWWSRATMYGYIGEELAALL